MSRALAAFEPCGCTAWIHVLGGHDDAGAYRTAAEQVEAGRRLGNVDVDEWKRTGFHCADHPGGPPWWESNGGDGKVPSEYAPNLRLGL